MDLIGGNAIALRLPAFVGFLLFKLCLFFFVRRLAGDRAAIVAMAVPRHSYGFRTYKAIESALYHAKASGLP
jgi:hypothetical protein